MKGGDLVHWNLELPQLMLGHAWSMRFKFTVLNTTTFVTSQHVWEPNICPYINTHHFFDDRNSVATDIKNKYA